MQIEQRNSSTQKSLLASSANKIKPIPKSAMIRSVRTMLTTQKDYQKIIKVREHKIKRLDLSQRDTRIIDDGMKSFGNRLRKIKTLHGFSFHGSETIEMQYNEYHMLAHILSKLQYLNDLVMSFYGCPGSMKDPLVMLGTLLRRIHKLHTLNIRFTRAIITREGMVALKRFLSLNPNIHSLALTFDSCEKISNEEFAPLSAILKRLYKMKKLSLTIHRICDKISRERIDDLGLAISNLTGLHELSLTIGKVVTGSHRTAGLLHGISQLPNLNVLSLQIGFNIHGEELEQMLSKLRNLKKLTLNGAHCGMISSAWINNITHSLQHLKKLETIILNFPEFKLSGSCYSDLCNAMKKIPMLRIISANFSHGSDVPTKEKVFGNSNSLIDVNQAP